MQTAKIENGRDKLSAAKAKQDKAIYVTVPASVAYNLDRMNKVTELVLGRLGCPGCHSGFDIRYLQETRFRFNERLEMQDVQQF